MVELLTTKQLADKLGVHPETIRRMVRVKRIPYVQISKTNFKFNLDDVMNSLNEKDTTNGEN